MANKVRFGLSNVHYAKIEKYEDGKYTYADPKPLPGAVALNLDIEGSSTPFYADNIVYFNAKANSGYSGDLEIAFIPNDFRTEILGDTETDGVIIENADAQGNEFALLFQFEGDVSGRKQIMWRCSAERPSVSGETKEDTTTPQTETITITAMARENDHNVKAFCDFPDKTDEAFEAKKEKYDNWFKSVWQPTENTETQAASTYSARSKSSSML